MISSPLLVPIRGLLGLHSFQISSFLVPEGRINNRFMKQTTQINNVARMEKEYNRRRKFLSLLVVFAMYMTCCTLFYTYYEKWDASVALSFIVATMTTTGFGYQTPSDDGSRLFTVFSMILGVFVIFGGISSVFMDKLAEQKSKKEFYTDLDQAELIQRDIRRRIVVDIVVIVLSMFTAALLFYWMEGWSFITALYFAVQTATTVGYGDIELHPGKGTNVVVGIYTFLSTILLAFAIGNVTSVFRERRRLHKIMKIAERRQTLARLRELDEGEGVSKDAFVLAVLEQLGVLDREHDIMPWMKKFEQLDAGKSGVLRKSEIERFGAAEYCDGVEQVERVRNMEEGTGQFNLWATLADTLGMVAGWLGLQGVAHAAEEARLRVSELDRGSQVGVRSSHYRRSEQQKSVGVYDGRGELGRPVTSPFATGGHVDEETL